MLIDSGVRRGSDVVKALSLGAKAVMVGRAPLYGVAAAGETGASQALQILREETDRVMAFLGCPTVADLGRHCVENWDDRPAGALSERAVIEASADAAARALRRVSARLDGSDAPADIDRGA